MKTLEEERSVSTNGHTTNGHIDHSPVATETPLRKPFPGPTGRLVLEEIKKRKKLAGSIGAAVVLLLAFFLIRGGAKHQAPGNQAIPVGVQTLTEKTVRLWSEFSGKLQAVDYAEIRPEVAGRITQVRFEDGQTVKKGDVLFVIDPAPYAAAVARAEAQAQFAKTEADRAAGLVESQAIAQRLYDERNSANLIAQAELSRARIDLDRAYVKAPISGRVGRPEITVGNLVQTANAPLLTSIVSNNGIYADFEVDEQTYLGIRGHVNGRDQERAIPVELTAQGDKTKTYKGTIYSFDNHLDNISGTIRARAKFPNEDGTLIPGMFVSIKIGSSAEVPTVLVPERAIGTDQNKKFVYVVGVDNKVVYREVRLGKQVGSDRVALSGLQAGERIVVDGTQHVRPDAMVAPTEVAAAPTALAQAQ